MESMNLMPVETGSGFGTGGAAALGAFVGSWIGNGFGGGWGGSARNVGVAGGVYPDVSNGVALGANVAATALISDLSTLQDSANQNALAVASGVAGVNQNISSGLSSLYSSLNGTLVQGMMADQTQTAAIQSTLCQGFSGLNQSVYQSGVDTRFSINALGQQMAQCCCETQKTIAAEGSATRALINDRYINQLQTELCDAKAKIGSLESNIYLTASQQAQTQQIINTVIAHINAK